MRWKDARQAFLSLYLVWFGLAFIWKWQKRESDIVLIIIIMLWCANSSGSWVSVYNCYNGAKTTVKVCLTSDKRRDWVNWKLYLKVRLKHNQFTCVSGARVCLFVCCFISSFFTISVAIFGLYPVFSFSLVCVTRWNWNQMATQDKQTATLFSL